LLPSPEATQRSAGVETENFTPSFTTSRQQPIRIPRRRIAIKIFRGSEEPADVEKRIANLNPSNDLCTFARAKRFNWLRPSSHMTEADRGICRHFRASRVSRNESPNRFEAEVSPCETRHETSRFLAATVQTLFPTAATKEYLQRRMCRCRCVRAQVHGIEPKSEDNAVSHILPKPLSPQIFVTCCTSSARTTTDNCSARTTTD
jgi:hypothetical protein